MISLIWPYWQRQSVTDRNLLLLDHHYEGMDLEVVVVDDGNQQPFRLLEGIGVRVKVVRLPVKQQPMNACVPYNRGVEAASGDYIALSGPDILHVRPVLGEMLHTAQQDRNNYVIAAVWFPERNTWHCHSTLKRSDGGDVGSFLPQGADYHFMTMLHRSLWERCGGFDEDYRKGAGYDDPDLVLRLARAGARFVRRDDLVLEHVRKGAHTKWLPQMFERNRALFMSKWGNK